jgi:hypothetical protein
MSGGALVMTSIFDNYGERAREHLKEEFNADSIQRDIGYAERDKKDISTFITSAKEQIAVIEKTTFKRYIDFKKGRDYYAGKIEFSVSVYQVPQVPGNEKLKVYSDDGKRYIGNDKRKEAIGDVLKLIVKYPDAELIGNGAELIQKAHKKGECIEI